MTLLAKGRAMGLISGQAISAPTPIATPVTRLPPITISPITISSSSAIAALLAWVIPQVNYCDGFVAIFPRRDLILVRHVCCAPLLRPVAPAYPRGPEIRRRQSQPCSRHTNGRQRRRQERRPRNKSTPPR